MEINKVEVEVEVEVVCISRSCNTTNALCNPWTASKFDRATKIILTLLFKDGFQKFKNSVKADEILFDK